MKVDIQPQKQVSSNSQLSANDVLAIQADAGLTDRQLLQVLKNIRVKFGRHSVESNIKSTLAKRKTLFADTQAIIDF